MYTVEQVRHEPRLIDVVNELELDALDKELETNYPRKVVRLSDRQTLRQAIKDRRGAIKNRDARKLLQQIIAVNSLEELNQFEKSSSLWNAYAGKMLVIDGSTNVRAVLENHRRAYQFMRGVKKLELKVTALAIYNLSLQIHPFMEELIHIHGRNHSNAIHDLPYIHSGWVSMECFKEMEQDKTYNPSKEHFHSRQQSGNTLVRESLLNLDYLNNRPLSEILLEFAQQLHVFVHVHFVTPKENNRLMKHQQNENLCWQEAYGREQIILLPITKEAVQINNPNACLERQLWNELFNRIKNGSLNKYFWNPLPITLDTKNAARIGKATHAKNICNRSV